jgi:glycosyltransferase involved in cell wall biosynthesis
MDVVCVSELSCDNPWLPVAQAHIMRQFALGGDRVLFVNPPLRWLADYRQLRRDRSARIKATTLWRQAPRQSQHNFREYTPPPLVPLNRVRQRLVYRAILRLNQAIYRAAVRAAMARIGMTRPLLWIALDPLLGQALINAIAEQLVVYHVTDNLSGFGVYNPELELIEQEVARSAQLVVCTSEQLRERMLVHNPRSFCVPNAVNIEHFKQALGDLPEPADLSHVPHPRAMYVGNLEDRVDLDLLRNVSEQLTHVAIVLIGPVEPRVREEIRRWGRPNMYVLGPRPHAVIPAYLRAADVALIPHRVNDLTRYMYPLKLHEYLATGTPVVSTDLPPLQPFRSVVTVADGPRQFIDGVRFALSHEDSDLRARRIAVAESNDWHSRARALADLVHGAQHQAVLTR